MLVDNFLNINEWASEGPACKAVTAIQQNAEHAIQLEYTLSEENKWALIRKEAALDLSGFFTVSFALRGQGNPVSIEVKFITANGNVFWNRQYCRNLSEDWQTVKLDKGDFSFAWGPNPSQPLQEATHIELVAAYCNDAEGTIQFKDLVIEDISIPIKQVTVTASSVRDGHPSQQVLDKKPLTSWQSKTDDASPWIAFDLGDHYDIGGLSLHWGTDYPREVMLETSQDGTNWTKLHPCHNDSTNQIIAVNMPNTQHIRLHLCNHATDNGVELHALDFLSWHDLARHKRMNRVHGLTGCENCPTKIFVSSSGSCAADDLPYMISFALQDMDSKKIYTPETLETDWQLASNGVPINMISWEQDDLTVSTTIFSEWVASLDQLFTYIRIHVANISDTNRQVSLYPIIQPNPMCRGYVRQVDVMDDYRMRINGMHTLYFSQPMNTSMLEDAAVTHFRDIAILDKKNSSANQQDCASAFRLSLKPGETKGIDIIMGSKEITEALVPEWNAAWSQHAVEHYWNTRIPMKLELPDQRYTDCFNASVFYQLIMMHNYMLCPGPINYKSFFLHDGIDMINSLNMVGLKDVTQHALPYFKYKTGDNYLDGLGGSIFAWFEYYRYTHDKEALREAYPYIIEKCKLIKQMRSESQTAENQGQGIYGLMPLSLSQDNWNFPSHLYVDNWWNLVGIKCGLEAAQILEEPHDKEWLEKEYTSFHNDLLASFEQVMQRDGIDYLPGFADRWESDKRIKDADHRILGETQMAWAHRAACYPGISLGIDIPTNLLRHSYKKYWDIAGAFSDYDGGWFVEYERVFWGYNVKLAQPMMYLGMGDIAIRNIEWSLNNQSCPGGWMEAMPSEETADGKYHIDTKGGIIGDVPHGWSASHYIILLRNMLLREQNNTLHLLSAVPDQWFNDGEKIAVHNAPTYYGLCTFCVESHTAEEYIEITIDMKTPPPNGYTITLPISQSVEAVFVNGEILPNFDTPTIHIPASAKHIRLQTGRGIVK